MGQYRLGVFACLFVTVLLTIWLAHVAHRRGTHWAICALLPLGALFNPLTFKAIDFGHPEEPLAAALALAAIVLAFERRRLAAGITFGIALATKQWTLLLIGPFVLAAAPSIRRPALLAAIATAIVLFAPVALGDMHRFRLAQQEAAKPHANSNPNSVFWPLTVKAADQHFDPGVERRHPPAWLASLSHWLVLGVAIGLALLVGRRAREPDLSTPLLLAAVILLLRCLFDAYGTFAYHHWPFVAALGAYEIVGRRRFPYLGAVATICLWLISEYVNLRDGADRLLGFYMAWSLPFLVVLAYLTVREVRLRAAWPR